MQLRTHFTILLITLITCNASFARDAARDLKKMKGFTIIDAALVAKVAEGKMIGTKVIALDNGMVFEIDLLLLDPFPMEDVIVFAKPFSKEIREKLKELPESLLFEYKLLIDNEVYDVRPLLK
jgi:hypothetical protein